MSAGGTGGDNGNNKGPDDEEDKGPAPSDGNSHTKHSTEQMRDRNVSQERIDEAINKGRDGRTNDPEKTNAYEVPSKDSASGRGVRIVVDRDTVNIITVIDKGSKYK